MGFILEGICTTLELLEVRLQCLPERGGGLDAHKLPSLPLQVYHKAIASHLLSGSSAVACMQSTEQALLSLIPEGETFASVLRGGLARASAHISQQMDEGLRSILAAIRQVRNGSRRIRLARTDPLRLPPNAGEVLCRGPRGRTSIHGSAGLRRRPACFTPPGGTARAPWGNGTFRLCHLCLFLSGAGGCCPCAQGASLEAQPPRASSCHGGHPATGSSAVTACGAAAHRSGGGSISPAPQAWNSGGSGQPLQDPRGGCAHWQGGGRTAVTG